MKKPILFILLILPLIGCYGKKVHSDFNLSIYQFEEMISPLPEEVRSLIMANPEIFMEKLSLAMAGPEELLWLVDKDQGLNPDYAPDDLEEISFYGITGTRDNMKLRKIIISPLLSLFQSASQMGYHLVVGSAYRSYSNQQALYQYWVEFLGQEQADRESARPGHSQHQLGTTLDFSPIEERFGELPEGKWLMANAWKFGFSMSYPSGMEEKTGYIYEPWHYRYMGVAAADLVQNFFQGNQQLFLEFFQLRSAFLKPLWLGKQPPH
ncbi:MAG: M15 family metallopeptidase [Spirochaetales bacterium]|nr:M15 family metallopeptidase [Spirochaetales bacterium]